MGEDTVVYHETDDVENFQRLFPISTYVRMLKLIWTMTCDSNTIILPNKSVITLKMVGNSSYIHEKDAQILRRMRWKLEKWAALRAQVMQAKVSQQLVEQHRKDGHPTFMPECPDCRPAAGRMRSHFQLDSDTRPGGQLSVDIAGPFPECRYPSARNEDARKRAKFFLLSAYQVMTSEELKESIKMRKEARSAANHCEEEKNT